ncbi:hypothetical protein Gogos_007072 [Gossypium gossypioides]|uniref:O-methyltransferase C-terminal domain-containing protein n=1 Tax=Gossypium gossypioides TaxID=34282 RepID=A0A7J9C7N8_GOSGO|nr:hypothetical protein [Gossypium gossypioides]
MSISFIASVPKTRVLVQFRDWYLSIILLFLTLFVAISCCTVVFSFGYFLIEDITVECASALPMVLKFTTKPNAPLMLDRSFRLLPSYSVLTCSLRTLPVGKVERLYGLGPVCNFLTKNEDGVSLSTLSLLNQHQPPLTDRTSRRAGPDQHKIIMKSCYYLKGSAGRWNSIQQDQWWYDRTDSKLNKIFNKGMFDHSTFSMKKILEIYDGFEGLKTLVDVGGVEHVGEDMFASVPKGDAIFMKCYEAVPDNGKMIVADSILPDYPDPSLATKVVGLFDCTLWATNHGRKERTEKEFEALATRFEP